MLSEAQAWGLKSTAMLCAFFVALLFIPLFVRRELQYPDPLIDLRLFRSSAFSGGLVAVNLSYALLYSMFFLMSFLFIHGFNQSPISAGLHLALIPIALGLVAPFSGSIYARVGARTMTTSAMALCVAAVVWMSRSLAGGAANDFSDHGRARVVRHWARHVHRAQQQRDFGGRAREPRRAGRRHAQSYAGVGMRSRYRCHVGGVFMASVYVGGSWQQDRQQDDPRDT